MPTHTIIDMGYPPMSTGRCSCEVHRSAIHIPRDPREAYRALTWCKIMAWTTPFLLNIWKLWAALEGDNVLSSLLDFIVTNIFSLSLCVALEFFKQRDDPKFSWFFYADCREHVRAGLVRLVAAADLLNVFSTLTALHIGRFFHGSFHGRVCKGHTNIVRSVAFSGNGKRIVSGSADQTMWIWDAESGDAVIGPLKGHTGTITSVGFSPDGKLIVSGSVDDTIRIWDAENGRLVYGPFWGHISVVTSVAFSPDGKRVASGSQDRSIRIWDIETGELACSPIQGHTSTVTSVSFSSDGKHIASSSWDRSIRIWNAETGELFRGPFMSHQNAVMSVAFSPDGRRVVSGSEDCSIHILDVATGQTIGIIQGHTDTVRSVAFAPDGEYVVSCSDDKSVRIWCIESGEVVGKPLEGHADIVMSVCFSPDGRRVASGSMDKSVRVWELRLAHKTTHSWLPGTTFEICRNCFVIFSSRLRRWCTISNSRSQITN